MTTDSQQRDDLQEAIDKLHKIGLVLTAATLQKVLDALKKGVLIDV